MEIKLLMYNKCTISCTTCQPPPDLENLSPGVYNPAIMGTWEERLEQERLLAAQRSTERSSNEEAERARLRAYLDKLGTKSRLEDIRDKVWKDGSVVELGGSDNKGRSGNAKCFAYQLHYSYQDVGKVYEDIGSSEYGFNQRRSNLAVHHRPMSMNFDITVGAASVKLYGRNYDTSGSGDYVYVIAPSSVFRDERHWTFFDSLGRDRKLMPASDEETIEFIDQRLLTAIDFSFGRPDDKKRQGEENISLFRRGLYKS